MLELSLPTARIPNYPVRIDPRFLASSVWVPHASGPADLLEKSDFSVNPTYVTPVIGPRGLIEYKHTGASYTAGISVAAPATTYDSWFIVSGGTASIGGYTGGLLGNSSYGLYIGGDNRVSLRAASTTMITSAGYLSPYLSLYASFKGGAYVLSEPGSWQTYSSDFGSGKPTTLLDIQSLSILLAVRWNDYQPPRSLIEELHRNPLAIFEPQKLYIPVDAGGAPQLLAPISDLSAGGWTPSSGSDLYAMLDEGTASDADYIVSTTATSCEMRLAVGTDPIVSTGHILRYRLLAGNGSIAAVLKQGATTIASYGPHTLTGAAQDFSQTLTSGEANSITNYADLRVVFTSS